MVKKRRGADTYHHGDLKEALVTAGRTLLQEGGRRGFTLRECARRANVSHAAPAHHFASADDLLAEIAARGFDDLNAAMDEGAAGRRDPASRLSGIGRGYVNFALANRTVFQLMFDRDIHATDNAHLTQAAMTAYERLIGGINAVIPGGTPSAKQAIADLAWSSVHGFAMLALDGQIGSGDPRDPELRRRLDHMLKTMNGAIGPH
jgi:AcrR family transcriptional regulator